MKLVVKQDIFAKALSAVSKVATPKVGLPILANVLLRTDGNKLIIVATNLEVGMTATLNAQVSEQGALTAPARLLTDFVGNLPHANVELSDADDKLNISCGGYSSVINTIAADDFPAMPEPTGASELTLKGELLRAAISGTGICAGNDVTRPILTGVYLYSEEGELYMAATDGYRLAERHMMATNQSIKAIIPGTTMQDAMRLIPDEPVTLKYNDEQVSFLLGDITLTSRLIEGKYIQYRQLLPSETNFTVKVNRADLLKAARVASLFAYVVSNTIVLEGDPVNHRLVVRSVTSQLGNNSSALEADITAQGDGTPSVNVNAKFLIDGLSALEGDEVTLMFNGGMAPILLTGANPDYRHLIMPVR